MDKVIKITRIIFIFITMFLLTACMDVATSGAQAIYNRHAIEKSLTDQYITMQASQALNYKTNQFNNANISIATYHNEVLLAGQVPQEWQKNKAENIIKKIPKVKEIHNLLVAASPSSMLTRLSDAWITAKVKAKFLASDDVDATEVKVVTENGVVYLMGILQPDAAEAAIDIASHTDGVLSVVKIFSYITISKTINKTKMSV